MHRPVTSETLTKPAETLSKPIETDTVRSEPINVPFKVTDGNICLPMIQRELYVPISVENVTIHFSDFTSHVISKKIFDEYKVFQQNPIMRTRKTFIDYILPLLNNDRMIMKSCDTFEEMSTIINEINYYGLKLTQQQIMDLHVSCGALELMQKMKMKYYRNMSKCLNSEFKRRLNVFSEYWNTMIDKLAQYKKDDEYKKITFELIMKIVENGSLFDLLTMNIYYENQIFMFWKYFKSVVFDNDDSELVQLIENISSSIPKIAESTENVIFNTIDLMTGNKLVSSAVRSVIDATKLVLESKNSVMKN
jgi:hypothetical protein